MKFHLITTEGKHQTFMKRLAQVDVVGFDTEAVGPARRYSQSRDTPFLNLGYTALQGFSIAVTIDSKGERDHIAYYPLRHRKQNSKWAWAEEAWGALAGKKVWAHNVKFDSALMEADGFDIGGRVWLDSMLAAWLATGDNSGLGLKPLAERWLDRKSPAWEGSLIDKTAAEVLEYVCHDALNTMQVGDHASEKLTDKQRWALRDIETPFAIELGRMERRGIRLDIEKLAATMGKKADADLGGKEKRWDELAPDANPASAKSLQELFEDGTWEDYGRTKDGQYKTGRDVMEYNEKNARTDTGRELATLCLDIRAARKVKGTYLEGFYEELRQWPDRKLHPELLQLGTRTGRLSSSNPNIQNQLSKGDYAPLLKECYVAEPGWSFVSADYAQIELRLFAELAGGSLLQAYIDGADLHQRTADAIKGTRDNGKTFNFGFLIYGGGPRKAAREFNWDEETAKQNIAAVGAEYPEAQAFRDKVIRVVEQRLPVPYVATKTGRRRYVPELRPNEWMARDPLAWMAKAQFYANKYGMDVGNISQMNRVIRSAGERISVNTIIQGSAADLAKFAMVNFSRATNRDEMHLVTMVHDEVLGTAIESKGEECAGLLKHHMEAAGPLLGYKVPILAEPAVGKTWHDVH